MSSVTFPLRPSFWPLQVSGWLTCALIYLLSAIPAQDFIGEIQDRESLIAALFASTIAIRPLYRNWFRQRTPPSLFASRALLLCIATGAVCSTVVHLSLGAFRFHAGDCLYTCAVWAIAMTLAWSALYFGILSYLDSVRDRERALRAESLLRTAQVEALRYQLNPHFLFNTLNSISTLVLDGDREGANSMLVRLGAFLRARLESQGDHVTLEEELGCLHEYLAIEKLRLEERLRLSIDPESDVLRASVPPMILQPVVENAIVHGIIPQSEGGDLRIRAFGSGDALVIEVWNSVCAQACAKSKGAGIGLKNTRQRLSELYGDAASVEIVQPPDAMGRLNSWLVKLRLPLKLLPQSAAGSQRLCCSGGEKSWTGALT